MIGRRILYGERITCYQGRQEATILSRATIENLPIFSANRLLRITVSLYGTIDIQPLRFAPTSGSRIFDVAAETRHPIGLVEDPGDVGAAVRFDSDKLRLVHGDMLLSRRKRRALGRCPGCSRRRDPVVRLSVSRRRPDSKGVVSCPLMWLTGGLSLGGAKREKSRGLLGDSERTDGSKPRRVVSSSCAVFPLTSTAEGASGSYEPRGRGFDSCQHHNNQKRIDGLDAFGV